MSDALLRIWPTRIASVWPPLMEFEEDMLERFHKRCGVSEGP